MDGSDGGGCDTGPKTQEKTLLSGQQDREKGPHSLNSVERSSYLFFLFSHLLCRAGILAVQSWVTAQEEKVDRNIDFLARGLGNTIPGAKEIPGSKFQGGESGEGVP